MLVSIKTFIIINHLLLYSIGAAGWFVLSKRYRFPPLVSLLGFAVFFFNGHIVAHTGAGHVMWSGYFLLTWFVLLMLRACEEEMTMSGTACLALVLGGMVAQGACHLFIWCLLFMGGFFIVRPRRHRMILTAALLSCMLATFRFAPAALAFGSQGVQRLEGFLSPVDFVHSLVSLSIDSHVFPWEYDFFIGMAGAVGILLLLAAVPFLRAGEKRMSIYWPLVLPAGFLMVLAFDGNLYFIVDRLHLPVLGTQRVPSRLAILPLVAALAIACISASRMLAGPPPRRWQLAASLAGVLAGASLIGSVVGHLEAWRMTAMESTVPIHLLAEIEPMPAIVTRPDPLYVKIVWGSLAFSAGVLALLLYMLWRKPSGLAQTRTQDGQGGGPR